jgi:D-3-phosphoglycerate dehydrogenase
LSKPVVLVAEELSPAGLALLEPGFDVRRVNGADREELLAAVTDVDAVIVRSATRIDAEVLAAARRLRVVARAGVGLDNVDVEAATKAGVMVVNAPTSNIVTAAEHAIALLLATARNVPQGHSALKQGEWKRSRYTGVELQEKTVGVLGLRHEGDRLRPVRPGAARRPARGAARHPGRTPARERLHHRAPAEDQGDARADRRP